MVADRGEHVEHFALIGLWRSYAVGGEQWQSQAPGNAHCRLVAMFLWRSQ